MIFATTFERLAWAAFVAGITGFVTRLVRWAGRAGRRPAARQASAVSARARGCARDLGQRFVRGHTGVGLLKSVAQRIEALLHPPDAFEQTGIDEGRNGLAVPPYWTRLSISPRF